MEKIDYEHGTFTILTNYPDYEDYPYEEYVKECEINGVEPGEPESDEFYEWCHWNTQENFECDLDNIKECKEYDVPVVISGTLGLWWGKPEIEPVEMDSVYKAIKKCMGQADYVEAFFTDGVIEVHSTHHDGTNCFTIKAKRGRLPYLYAIGI